jgi:hypothetical protein
MTCAIQTGLNIKCDTDDKKPAGPKMKILQPLMIIPLPSPNCETDWNYNFHGMDWVCKCNEGLE